MTEKLVFILGDQLSPRISSLAKANPETDKVLMVEVMEEATYARHHKKKIAFLFSAMRHFAEELRGNGWRVDYVKLDAPANTGSFSGEIKRAQKACTPDRILVTEPGEWRVLEAIKAWENDLDIPVDILPDDRFIASHDEFQNWAQGRKQLRMEYFLSRHAPQDRSSDGRRQARRREMEFRF